MQTILDTKVVAPANRQEFWIEEVIRGRDIHWQVDAGRARPSQFFGRLEVIRAGNGVTFNRYQSDPMRVFRPFALQTDCDDHFILASPAQVGGVIGVNGKECLCPPGRWILVDKRFPVSLASSEWRRDTKHGVDIPRPMLQEIMGRELEMPRPWLLSNTLGTPAGLLCDTLNAGFRQMLRMSDPSQVSALVAEQICNLLSMALVETPTGSELGGAHVDEALRYMQNHHDDHTLSPAQVAWALGISRSLLYTRFAERGRRFSAELRRIRCEQAAQLLRDRRNRHWSVEAVAYAVGFSGSAALIRAFRGRYATTPARYRNLYC
ncbi:MAG TPA: AraC family transcriptional regulator [Gammaproteobacteria bacterium]|nr:AraC family transcriptional regulator [Gammaproteobacteria bacterium]